MAYTLYDCAGNSIKHHDLQDKGPWCVKGSNKEDVFVKKFGQQTNLIINPEKKNNPYAPDLLNIETNNLADLKTQNTPFFQAKKRYGKDPQYAFTFNVKDKERYERKYPNIEIYLWVDWIVVRFVSGTEEIKVEPMKGVWYVPFNKLLKILEHAPLHPYYQRRNDTKGNAKVSYVLSVEEPEIIKLI